MGADDRDIGVQKPSSFRSSEEEECLVSISVVDMGNSSTGNRSSVLIFVCLFFTDAFEEEGLGSGSDCRRFEPAGSADLVDER